MSSWSSSVVKPSAPSRSPECAADRVETYTRTCELSSYVDQVNFVKKAPNYHRELEPYQNDQIAHLEKSQSFLDVGVGDERLECHLGEALGDPHHRLQLPHSDGDGQPLLTLLLHLEKNRPQEMLQNYPESYLAARVPHQHIAVLQFLGSLPGQPWATASPVKNVISKRELALMAPFL